MVALLLSKNYLSRWHLSRTFALLLCVLIHHTTSTLCNAQNEPSSRVLSKKESSNHHEVEYGMVKNGQVTTTTTTTTTPHESSSSSSSRKSHWKIGQNASDRCEWLWQQFEDHTSWMDLETKIERYRHQTEDDTGRYYRSSSHVFWADFVRGEWSRDLLSLPSHLQEYSTYTWVSGDLHHLNFGAWQNSNGDVVFGMNDFDESAIADFQVDVVRLATSIYDQVMKTGGVKESNPLEAARRCLHSFLKSYVDTVRRYVSNVDAPITTGITKELAEGSLRNFLESLEQNEEEYSRKSQITKYAKMHKGKWRFKKGTSKKPKHKLAEVSSDIDKMIRQAFTPTGYGASLMKFGRSKSGAWDESYYEVLDVARRVGSGVGSFGVDRFYVLIQGNNTSDTPDESGPFILDMKYQPAGSFREVISPSDSAWYDQHFLHEAARVTEAQRRLTAFTDPFTGWVTLQQPRNWSGNNDKDGVGQRQPFTVRERSPWKESFDLDALQTEDELVQFSTQLGMATATSHVRGNVGEFKHVIASLFAETSTFDDWVSTVIETAVGYHDQVHLDFKCFYEQVKIHYPRAVRR